MPANEAERLEALRRYDVLDTPPEPAFDDLTAIAALVCDVPIALVSLVDSERQWFKSNRGLGFDETRRDVSFCTKAILGEDVFVVPDALSDPRFRESPLVMDGPRVRFYAGAPLLTADGHALGTLCVMDHVPRDLDSAQRDTLRALAHQAVTQLELRRKLLELARAEAELDHFFNLSLEMLCVAGFDGYFKRLNPVWQEVLGHTLDELMTTPYLDFVHPEDREPTIREARKIETGASTLSFENRYVCKNGAYKWLSWNAVPFSDRGLIFAAARDITARREAEQALKEARRHAEESTRAKSEFLAHMSHEIRTPLNAITGMTDLALSTRLTGEQREYLAAVKDSAGSLLALVNDSLDLSRIEARRLELDRVSFDLEAVVEDTLRMLALRAHQKGLELLSYVRPGVPSSIRGDPRRLRQILLNLIGNAIKFTEAGEVLLSVETESSKSRDEAEAVFHFIVSDTGIGIPPEKRERIFEAFEQVDQEARRIGGTGLGLTISAELVAMMGGRIWVESEKALGSTFHFTARFEIGESAAPKTTELESLAGLSVIVVDDNATACRVMVETLNAEGLLPRAADGVWTAFAMAKQAAKRGRPFGLALVDATLREVDAHQLARRFKRDRELARIPLILLATAAEKAAKDFVAVVRKPVKREELWKAILSAVGARRPERRVRRTRLEPRHRARRLRILLAEDGVVNQKLAAKLLGERGHTVTIVRNGREALEILEKTAFSGFDVVLMDIQMPEMDGLEATVAIREKQKGSGRHIPIVAMTAYAMIEDRERSFAAGMDAYISKPFQKEELYATVESLAPRAGANERSPLDRNGLLERVGGDPRLLKKLVGLFLDDLPKRMRDIRKAVRSKSAKELAVSVHALKGAVANFAAPADFDALVRLGNLGRQGTMDGAAAILRTLEKEMVRLEKALSKIRGRRS